MKRKAFRQIMAVGIVLTAAPFGCAPMRYVNELPDDQQAASAPSASVLVEDYEEQAPAPKAGSHAQVRKTQNQSPDALGLPPQPPRPPGDDDGTE